jgi:hypothetical protein
MKAFTLFESVVAITIITILIALSTMIYSNIVESEKPLAYYQAKQEVTKIFNETKQSQAFFSKNYNFETFDIEQKVDFHQGNKKLYQIDYTISAQGKQWWTEKHLVANRQDAR